MRLVTVVVVVIMVWWLINLLCHTFIRTSVTLIIMLIMDIIGMNDAVTKYYIDGKKSGRVCVVVVVVVGRSMRYCR